MAEERAVQRNWRRLKDELTPHWQLVLDITLETGAVTFDDIAYIKSIPSQADRIATIVEKVIRQKKAKEFLAKLENNEFENLCKQIREQVDQNCTETIYTRSNTYTLESTDRQGLGELEKMIDEKLKVVKEEVRSGNQALRTDIKKGNDEILNVVDIKMKEIEALYSQLSGIEEKYTYLQKAYEQSREKNNHLTQRCQEKTMNNHKLTLQVTNLKETIDQMKNNPPKTDKDLISKYETELESYKEKLAERESESFKERQAMKELTDKVNESNIMTENLVQKLEKVEQELERVNQDFQKLMKENKDLREKSAVAVDMKRMFEKLSREIKLHDREMRSPPRPVQNRWNTRPFIDGASPLGRKSLFKKGK